MHRSQRSFPVFVLLLLTALSTASASPHWIQATPFGGQMVTAAVAPSSPQTLYAATVTGRFFRSLDGGLTWSERKSGLPDALITDLVVDFQDARTVFARTSTPGKAAVLRTRNGGLTWTETWPGVGSVYGLTLDGRSPGVVYAAANDGLYRSSDSGATWSVIAFANSTVFATAIDPHASDLFLAAVYKPNQATTAFWRSTDKGATWTESAAGERSGFGLQRIVFDPVRAVTAYAFLGPQGDQGTALRTTDGGITWSLLASTVDLHDLLPSPNGTLLAAASFGIARSNDLGETWEPPLPAALTPETAPRDVLSRLIASPAAPETVLAAGVEGIWKSTDGGGSWSTVNQGIGALPVISLAVSGPEVVALAGDAVFRSEDQGGTWRRGLALEAALPFVLDAIDPRDPQTVYGVGFDGQAAFATRSTDGGIAWSVLPTGFACGGDSICEVEMPGLVIDPRRPGGLFLGVWTFIHFQGFSQYLLYSPDGGETWQDRTPLHSLQSLAIDPQGKALYGLNCKAVYKSENAGVSWRKVGFGLPAKSLCVYGLPGRRRLAVDPHQPQTLYVGTAGQGVFRSTDGGVTFRPFNRGLQTADVATVLVDGTGSVYAAISKKGVWRWDESLRRWTPLNVGLPLWDFAGVLALDPEHPSVLYAGTQGHGVYRLDL